MFKINTVLGNRKNKYVIRRKESKKRKKRQFQRAEKLYVRTYFSKTRIFRIKNLSCARVDRCNKRKRILSSGRLKDAEEEERGFVAKLGI